MPLGMDILRQYPNTRTPWSMSTVCILVRILLDYVNSLRQSLHRLHLFRSSIDQCLRLIEYFRWRISEPQHSPCNGTKSVLLVLSFEFHCPRLVSWCLVGELGADKMLNLCISMNVLTDSIRRRPQCQTHLKLSMEKNEKSVWAFTLA